MYKMSMNKLMDVLRKLYYERSNDNKNQSEVIMYDKNGILLLIDLTKNKLIIHKKDTFTKVI